MKLLYLLQYPIHYQVPLLQKLASDQRLDLTVIYLSHLTVQPFDDKSGSGKAIKWDIPLLEGYNSQLLPSIGKHGRFSFFRPFVCGIYQVLNREAPDVIWVHGYANWALIWMILVAKQRGIKVLMRGESNLISAHRGPLKQFWKRILLSRLFRLCDGFLYIGQLNREYYCHYGVPDHKLFFMPYAVDNNLLQTRLNSARPHRETLRKQLGLQEQRPIILYASRLIKRKRPENLLEAYIGLSHDGRQEPWPYLIYVGDGEERAKLEWRAQELGWESIRFLGFQNQKQLPAYYDLCDVFVLPSIHEPWAVVVNEAMNAAKPIIVSDQVGSGLDLVTEGENGYVFPAGNTQSLATCLQKILESPGQAKKMGQASLAKINEWSFEQDVEGLLDAICSVFPSTK